MKTERVVTKNAEETAALAERLARNARGGEVFALIGELGAGKTTFTQAFSRALGVRERVQSPTFILLHEHRVEGREGIRRLAHADAYRGDTGQFRNIGFTDYLEDPECVTVIEWADRIEELLPARTVRIAFRHGGDSQRVIEIAT